MAWRSKCKENHNKYCCFHYKVHEKWNNEIIITYIDCSMQNHGLVLRLWPVCVLKDHSILCYTITHTSLKNSLMILSNWIFWIPSSRVSKFAGRNHWPPTGLPSVPDWNRRKERHYKHPYKMYSINCFHSNYYNWHFMILWNLHKQITQSD